MTTADGKPKSKLQSPVRYNFSLKTTLEAEDKILKSLVSSGPSTPRSSTGEWVRVNALDSRLATPDTRRFEILKTTGDFRKEELESELVPMTDLLFTLYRFQIICKRIFGLELKYVKKYAESRKAVFHKQMPAFKLTTRNASTHPCYELAIAMFKHQLFLKTAELWETAYSIEESYERYLLTLPWAVIGRAPTTHGREKKWTCLESILRTKTLLNRFWEDYKPLLNKSSPFWTSYALQLRFDRHRRCIFKMSDILDNISQLEICVSENTADNGAMLHGVFKYFGVDTSRENIKFTAESIQQFVTMAVTGMESEYENGASTERGLIAHEKGTFLNKHSAALGSAVHADHKREKDEILPRETVEESEHYGRGLRKKLNCVTWHELVQDRLPQVIVDLLKNVDTGYQETDEKYVSNIYTKPFDVYSYQVLFALHENFMQVHMDFVRRFLPKDEALWKLKLIPFIETWTSTAFGDDVTSEFKQLHSGKHKLDTKNSATYQNLELARKAAASFAATVKMSDSKSSLKMLLSPTTDKRMGLETFIGLAKAIVDKESAQRFCQEHESENKYYNDRLVPAMQNLSQFQNSRRGGKIDIHIHYTDLETNKDKLYWPMQIYCVDQIYRNLIHVGQKLIILCKELVDHYVSQLKIEVRNRIAHEVFWSIATCTSSREPIDSIVSRNYGVNNIRKHDTLGSESLQALRVDSCAEQLKDMTFKLTEFLTFTKTIIDKRMRLAKDVNECGGLIFQYIQTAGRFKDNIADFWKTNPNELDFVGAGSTPTLIAMCCIKIDYRKDLVRLASMLKAMGSNVGVENVESENCWRSDNARNHMALIRWLAEIKCKEIKNKILKAHENVLAEYAEIEYERNQTSYPCTLQGLKLLPNNITEFYSIADFGKVQPKLDACFEDIVRYYSLHPDDSRLNKACDQVYLCCADNYEDATSGFNSGINTIRKFLEANKNYTAIEDIQKWSTSAVQSISSVTVHYRSEQLELLKKELQRVLNLEFEFSGPSSSSSSVPPILPVPPAAVPKPDDSADKENKDSEPPPKLPEDVNVKPDTADKKGSQFLSWTFISSKTPVLRSERQTISDAASTYKIRNLQFVECPNLLSIQSHDDSNRVAFEEARLVTGDSSTADALNHCKLVQLVTSFLAYISKPIFESRLRDNRQELLRDANLDLLAYHIDNRMQCKPHSDMSTWTSASNVTYTESKDSMMYLLSALLGVEYREVIEHKIVDLRRVASNSWAAVLNKVAVADVSLNALFSQFDVNPTARYCVYEFANYSFGPDHKPNLEDMREIMRVLCKKNSTPAKGKNPECVYPLCYVYSVHQAPLTETNKKNVRREEKTFYVIDSTHQIREQVNTRVHYMIAAIKNRCVSSARRVLGSMPVRVCPLCGFHKSINPMTAEDFENHMYVGRYDCAIVQYMTDNHASSFFKTHVEHLELQRRSGAIVDAFRKQPVWSTLASVLFTNAKALRHDKLNDALEEIMETLTPPLVRGTNKFFTTLEREVGLTPAAYVHIGAVLKKIAPQFNRLLTHLRKSPDKIAEWATPRVFKRHSSSNDRNANIKTKEAYIRGRVWTQFCLMVAKIFLLNLPPSCFKPLPNSQKKWVVLGPENNKSIVETLLKSSNRPSPQTVDYFQDVICSATSCRVQPRSDVSRGAILRDYVDRGMAHSNANASDSGRKSFAAAAAAAAAAATSSAEGREPDDTSSTLVFEESGNDARAGKLDKPDLDEDIDFEARYSRFLKDLETSTLVASGWGEAFASTGAPAAATSPEPEVVNWMTDLDVETLEMDHDLREKFDKLNRFKDDEILISMGNLG